VNNEIEKKYKDLFKKHQFLMSKVYAFFIDHENCLNETCKNCTPEKTCGEELFDLG